VKATVGKLWFDIYRKPATVRSVLQLVYGRTSAIDNEVGIALYWDVPNIRLSPLIFWSQPLYQEQSTTGNQQA